MEGVEGALEGLLVEGVEELLEGALEELLVEGVEEE